MEEDRSRSSRCKRTRSRGRGRGRSRSRSRRCRVFTTLMNSASIFDIFGPGLCKNATRAFSTKGESWNQECLQSSLAHVMRNLHVAAIKSVSWYHIPYLQSSVPHRQKKQELVLDPNYLVAAVAAQEKRGEEKVKEYSAFSTRTREVSVFKRLRAQGKYLFSSSSHNVTRQSGW